MLGPANKVGSIPILLDSSRPSVDVEDDVKALLKARHRIAPDDERAISGFNRDKSFKRFQSLFFGDPRADLGGGGADPVGRGHRRLATS